MASPALTRFKILITVDGTAKHRILVDVTEPNLEFVKLSQIKQAIAVRHHDLYRQGACDDNAIFELYDDELEESVLLFDSSDIENLAKLQVTLPLTFENAVISSKLHANIPLEPPAALPLLRLEPKEIPPTVIVKKSRNVLLRVQSKSRERRSLKVSTSVSERNDVQCELFLGPRQVQSSEYKLATLGRTSIPTESKKNLITYTPPENVQVVYDSATSSMANHNHASDQPHLMEASHLQFRNQVHHERTVLLNSIRSTQDLFARSYNKDEAWNRVSSLMKADGITNKYYASGANCKDMFGLLFCNFIEILERHEDYENSCLEWAFFRTFFEDLNLDVICERRERDQVKKLLVQWVENDDYDAEVDKISSGLVLEEECLEMQKKELEKRATRISCVPSDPFLCPVICKGKASGDDSRSHYASDLESRGGLGDMVKSLVLEEDRRRSRTTSSPKRKFN